jgi:hypothetical protein
VGGGAMTVAELLARVVRTIEAIEDGDVGLAYAILVDLELDAEPEAFTGGVAS